jgi:ABC-type nitrate/sulfonate/bicarbonate transport system substrate-binding protein/LysM repeat protein
MKIKNIVSLLTLLVCSLILGGYRFATAADGPASQSLRKIAIAYSGISPSQSPIWVTYEAGLFRKYGLDVEMIFIESGSRTVQTLISGDVAAAQVAGAPVVQSNLKGSGIVMIAGLVNTLDYKLIVARDITRPEQLKGKVMAVSRAGGSSDFATRYALDKYGLVPDKDVTLIQIGSQPARFAALEAGKIQGVMIAVPLTAKATKAGFNTLADLQMLGLEYQHTALAFSRNLLKTQPELARNILKAFVDGIHYMKTQKRETMAILAKYLKTNDQDELEDAYESVLIGLVPRKPYPTIKGIQTILREFSIKDAAARAARPEQFVDLTFIKDLDASGFIDNLYKGTSVAKSSIEPIPATTVSRESTPQPVSKAKPVVVESKTKTPEPAAEKAPPVAVAVIPKSPLPGSQYYIVKAGDTLSKIAEEYYNSLYQWERIYEANKDIVKNPHFIYIGMKLVIPPESSSGG